MDVKSCIGRIDFMMSLLCNLCLRFVKMILDIVVLLF